MFKTRKGLLLIILVAIFWSGWEFKDIGTYFNDNGSQVNLSAQAEKHILYGTENGGGHKYGVGIPCKSEFPQRWDDKRIIAAVKDMAANDNLSWKKQDNGYYVAEDVVGGVKVRVVLDREKDDVVTAYPLNGKRNACNTSKGRDKTPSHANDNYND